jgi:hypothetical protein
MIPPVTDGSVAAISVTTYIHPMARIHMALVPGCVLEDPILNNGRRYEYA